MKKNEAENLIEFVRCTFEPLEYMALQIDNAMDYGEASVEQPLSELVSMTLISIKNVIELSVDEEERK